MIDLNTIFDLSPLIIGIVPVVVGLVEIVKRVGISERFLPLTSLVFGIALAFVVGMSWQVAIVQGIISGLFASGLYSNFNAITKK